MSRSRFTLLTLLSGRSHDYTHIARPLIHSLERVHQFAIEVAVDLSALNEGRARVLLAGRWRSSHQVVAYERQHGDGRFVQIGLRLGAATYQDAAFQKLVHRAVLFASGAAPAPTVGVGLIGYGAIARGHAESIAATPGLDMRAVADISAERLHLASRELGVTTYSGAEELLRDPDIGLVVVGTPPSVHADPVVGALQAGKHVVCEKPFAITVDDVDRMIDAAAAHRRVLTVYQSRRWDPDYLAMREAIRSGRIGELFYMESFIGGCTQPLGFWARHPPTRPGRTPIYWRPQPLWRARGCA